uniref:Ig-like domain-containing protein n=1 Tax=Biomphalaria glabrata TaxID=6526 RepID=A0A2C9KMU6_BIOGL
MSERVTIPSSTQELQINNLQYEDAGLYECWATNPLSLDRKNRTFTVRVQAKPYFMQELQNVELGINETAEFKCLAAGDPRPSIEWYINGIPLPGTIL